jgi:hypothetical protein
MLFMHLEGQGRVLEFSRRATAQSQMAIHRRLDKTLLVSIINTYLKIKGCLSRTLTHDLCFWLLQHNFKVALRVWLEFDNVVLFVVNHVYISNMEFAGTKFAHYLCSVETIRIIDPTTLLIED